ncbi:MAG: deoxyribodipyrimidine photolyase [Planctomycetes bacterium]|nr:deoxyribodipyrimidine photolyase [Planctomycetota bacterium]MCW8135945.1 deoxyribodipyrimidine photolyase [Planctomycetota bacterium]
MGEAPEIRIRAVNDVPARGGDYVLYWMIAARRPHASFSLEHALALAQKNNTGLVVLEALRCDYPWAGDRLHTFVAQGMADNAAAFSRAGLSYYPYIEPAVGAGKGLLDALAARALAVVTDDYPCFFLPRMVAAAGRKLQVPLLAVDGNGLVPLAAPRREFTMAHSYRRWLQKNIAGYLGQAPQPVPLKGARLKPVDLPEAILRKWPAAEPAHFDASRLPIDHGVAQATLRGGWQAARMRLEAWLAGQYARYDEGRNHPDYAVTSGLSPWLHFGHISPWEILDAIASREDWSPARLRARADGKRGWWGMSANGEALLEQLAVWRELGYQRCHARPDYDRYESLPAWARATLRAHAGDKRGYVYTPAQFEAAQTHDEVWNAAQRELVSTGGLHNYMRMLWGKCILAWSQSPQQALATMIHLNNKYALDGRDPNSYSGILWCLGLFDRAWGPVRPVFGTVRCMTTDSARRKLKLKQYLQHYARWHES